MSKSKTDDDSTFAECKSLEDTPTYLRKQISIFDEFDFSEPDDIFDIKSESEDEYIDVRIRVRFDNQKQMKKMSDIKKSNQTKNHRQSNRIIQQHQADDLQPQKKCPNKNLMKTVKRILKLKSSNSKRPIRDRRLSQKFRI